ncbi:hypothetical protein WJX73_007349 [Symbiochloris irregularis]|uniref:RecQ mediated genome instability protein 1 OB-fold domain-containing protein n=1 Tax=Symbiochloris irregularis TaxID=706552 RepID=A0AAW1NZV2_9CHLO
MTSLQRLQQEGWAVSEEAVSSLQQQAIESDASSQPDLRQLLLCTDLKKIGTSALPSGINTPEVRNLRGPLVLQVVSAEDVARPSKAFAGASKNRLLQLKLTDGKSTCKALEHSACPELDVKHLIPGTKVKLCGSIPVKLGFVLLEAKLVQVLGGRVEALAEPWEFQEKFGTLDRSADGKDAAAELPPAFTHFVPGKTRALPNSALEGIFKATLADQAAASSAQEAASTSQGAGNASQSKAGAASSGASRDDSTPRVAPMQATQQDTLQQARETGAAKKQLLAKLAKDESEKGGRAYGRGGRGRGRRRRYHDDDEDDGTAMTLEEWEARRKAPGPASTSGAAALSDEEYARRLQQQLDLEDGPLPPGMGFGGVSAQPVSSRQPRTAADDIRNSMFSFDRGGHGDDHEGNTGYRGRGRGGRRAGGRRGGRRG